MDGKTQEISVAPSKSLDDLLAWVNPEVSQVPDAYDIFVARNQVKELSIPFGAWSDSKVEIVIARRSVTKIPVSGYHWTSQPPAPEETEMAPITANHLAGFLDFSPSESSAASSSSAPAPLEPKEVRLPLDIDAFLENPPVPTVQVVLEATPGSFDAGEFKSSVALALGNGLSPDDIVILSVKSGSIDVVFMCKAGFSEVKAFVVDLLDSTTEKLKKLEANLRQKVKKIIQKDPSHLWTDNAACKGIYELGQAQQDEDLINLVEQASKIKPATASWLRQYKQKLTKQFESLLQTSQQDFFVDCTIVVSPLLDRFVEKHGSKELLPVFHATANEFVESIFRNGFYEKPASKQQLDEGYYGRGVYFTPHFEYALYYRAMRGLQQKGKEGHHYRENDGWLELKIGESTDVIGAVLAPGKMYKLGSQNFDPKKPSNLLGKEIKDGYDSHFARVVEPSFYLCVDEQKHKDKRIFTEYVAKYGHQALPFFHITAKRMGKLLVWFDANIGNTENQSILAMLRQLPFNLYAVSTVEEVESLLAKKRDCESYLITSGRDGERVVQLARTKYSLKTPILVFCGKVSRHSEWAKKYAKVQVTDDPDVVRQFSTGLLGNTAPPPPAASLSAPEPIQMLGEDDFDSDVDIYPPDALLTGADTGVLDESPEMVLFRSTENGEYDEVVSQISGGADVNTRNPRTQETIICAAARLGFEKIVGYLLTQGADASLKNCHDRTPLLWAAEKLSLECIREIFEANATAEEKDDTGKTIFHSWAVRKDTKNLFLIFEYFLDKGASFHATDRAGNTPLHDACRAGQLLQIGILLDWQAPVNIMNSLQQLPIDLAHLSNIDNETVLARLLPASE
eukprot:TRINITY_DN3639_c0_g1_i1.p1 TRINITY_DN3639_c0_g1~~TRINITY_DN3639_c0_g1_i1.p1  ORF type:complete len:923 (+),score=215.61 TRINITY_DN3639_c0_g1_i1:215-2770(+)